MCNSADKPENTMTRQERLLLQWKTAFAEFKKASDNTFLYDLTSSEWTRCVRMMDDYEKIINYLNTHPKSN